MNYELVSMIAAIVSAVASIATVLVAWLIFRRQRNISLFQRRIDILNAYDTFLYDILTDKEWDGSYAPINQYHTSELITIFGPEFAAIQVEVLNVADFVADCNREIREKEAVRGFGDDGVDDSVEELKKTRNKRIEEVLRFYHEVVDRNYGGVFKV